MKQYSKEKPEVFERYPNAWLYNFNIEKYSDDCWQFDSVELYEPITSDSITRSVIKSLWDNDMEQKLVNDYNSAMLDLYEGQQKYSAINKYTQYLQERNALRAQIENDYKLWVQ